MIRGIKNIAFQVFLTAIVTLPSWAQQPRYEFKASIGRDSIIIGDQIEYSIRMSLPKGYRVALPAYADTLARGIEILQPAHLDTIESSEGRIEYLYSLLVTSFDSGLHRIAPQKIAFGNQEPFDTAQTAAIWLSVLTLPRDTSIAGIYDIKQPMQEPITFGEVATWLGGGILVLGVLAFLIFIIRRLIQRKPIVLFEKPKEPAHVIALRKLQEMHNTKQWLNEDFKKYHSEVTEVVREYIEGRFGIAALEQTTPEIVRSLQAINNVSKPLLERFNELFTLSDLVKFAKYSSVVQENEQLLSFAFDFVNDTKEEEPKASNGNTEAPEKLALAPNAAIAQEVQTERRNEI